MQSLVGILEKLSWISNPKQCFTIVENIIKLFQDGEDEIVSEAEKELKTWEDTELTIAVTGETGSGKSSFINAFRGLKSQDEGFAPVGVTETTQKAKDYFHPNFPKVTFWDLPGVGSPTFPPETYLKQVEFHRYDFFIIVSSKRFLSSDARLAKEIQDMGKKFYFMRAKVDEDLRNIKRTDADKYNEEQVLKEMRDNCKQNLNAQFGDSIPPIFLTSCWDLDKYDFPLLLETLEKDLPDLKKLAFVLSLPNISPEVIEKKKDALKKQLWKIAVVSGFCKIATCGTGLRFDCDLMLKSMMDLYKKLGLDDKSLDRLANQVGLLLSELKAVIQSAPEKYIYKLLSEKQLALVREKIRFLSTAVNIRVLIGVFSFIVTYWTLCKFLDVAAEDAKRIFMKVSGKGKAEASAPNSPLWAEEEWGEFCLSVLNSIINLF